MTCILVVDDDPICLELLSETLIGAGYSVDLAVDGEDAWDKLNSYKHDLVLLDRVMPRLDGLGLLRRMKGDAALSGIPVIIQTSASSQDEILEGLEAGAHYYLCKPVYPDLLARDNYGGRSATIRMTGMRHRRVAPIPLSQASIAQQ